MKPNELRIGNYIYLSDKEKVWEILDGHEIDECYENPYTKSIYLTEEWLLKLGFQSNPYQDRYEKGVLHIECDKTKGYLQLWCEQLPQAIFIKYVHQLQNLYFALTGQELTYQEVTNDTTNI
jgi:hypothetical protein